MIDGARDLGYGECGVGRTGTGTSHVNNRPPTFEPTACAPMKPTTSAGRIPAYVSLSARRMVTAGFAKHFDAVNQYAATMYAATATGVIALRVRPTQITTPTSPNVAMPSLRSFGNPARTVVDIVIGSSPNIAFARAAP